MPEDSARKTEEIANLMLGFRNNEGSYRYKGVWNLLDQFMVSRSLHLPPGLMKPGQYLHLIQGSARIFRGDFLLKEDLKFFGKKPFRTYNGFRYEGGFSDHLPVYLDLGF